MNAVHVRKQASRLGIKTPNTLKKGDLIRLIQQCEGNYSCFATARSSGCGQEQCLWRQDCATSDRQAEPPRS